MPIQQHRVVIENPDGGVEMYPMKQWLRQHPEDNPTGIDPGVLTSHQLRNALRKVGWAIRPTDTEILLIRPSDAPVPKLLAQVFENDEAVEDSDDNSEIADAAFALEYQLRDFLAQNLNKINVGGKHVSLYVDHSGRNGIEYPSGVGSIDILAVDNEGSFYVFELKRARSPDHAIGQLARYMGWVRQTIGANTDVFGFIVAKTISNNLRYAISVIPKVSLFEYEIEFRLKETNLLPHK